MFQETEVINLLMGFISLALFLVKRKNLPRLNLLYFGYFSILCALVFTVIEGVIFKDFFNLLEHMFYAISGIFFAAGCYKYFLSTEKDPGKTE